MCPRRRQLGAATQAVAVRRRAWAGGWGSVALAQAIQFDLMLRQKDVIGEYLPAGLKEGGAGIPIGDDDGLAGLRRLVPQDQVIVDLRPKQALDPLLFVDLKLAPMVMEDLRRMGIVSRRGPPRLVKRLDGPIIVNESTGLPWMAFEFRRVWRAIARSEGIPNNVCSMHSRHGGVSEGFDAGANPDDIRAAATHSDLATTQGYNRGSELERSSNVLIARARHRGKTPVRRRAAPAKRSNRRPAARRRAA